MHKIFGTKENVVYNDRRGAYIIPICGTKIAVVKTPKGYFLLGGGAQRDESDEQAIIRECIEEIGYTVDNLSFICSAETYTKHSELGYFHPIQAYYTGSLLEKVQEPSESDHELLWVEYADLKGNMFVKMQNWAIDIAMKR